MAGSYDDKAPTVSSGGLFLIRVTAREFH
jgi:hypothetical protein